MVIPPPPLWARRLVQIVWLPIVALLTALCVPLFIIAVLLWPIDRKLRAARVLALFLVFLWLDAGLVTGVFYIWLRHLFTRDREFECARINQTESFFATIGKNDRVCRATCSRAPVPSGSVSRWRPACCCCSRWSG